MNNKSTHSIGILGCGWLGERIASYFLQIGYTVKGSTRNQNRFEELKTLGIEPFLINLKNSIENSSFFDVETLIVSVNKTEAKDHTRLLSLIEKRAIKKVLFISSTSVYKTSDKGITEDSSLIESTLVNIEKVYLNSNKTYILRCSGIVGDNRHPGSFIKPEGIIKNPCGVINLIHFEDIIKSIHSIIANSNLYKIYNLVSDEHPNRVEFYSASYQYQHGISANYKKGIDNLYKNILNDRITKEYKLSLKLCSHYKSIFEHLI